jgi:hypothetical protein
MRGALGHRSPGPPGRRAGPPAALWQYIAVNMVPTFLVELFDGRELVPVDPARDDKAPLYYPDRVPFSPATYHFQNGYGAIRRRSGDRMPRPRNRQR